MIGLFQIAPQDQSIYYLSQLFGYIGNVLPSTSSTIFGAMFKTLNTTALVLGSLMVIHTTVLGLIKTAHEGEFLGKQWSSLWVPLRTVMGIAALFPTGSGYSVMQVGMMWFIVQGVGAADTLWTTIIDYVATMGSPYASMSPPTMGTQQSFTTLFQALVCQAEAHRSDPDIIPGGSNNYFYCAKNPTAAFCQLSEDQILNITDTSNPAQQVVESPSGVITYKIGPSTGPTTGACGTLQYYDPAVYVDPNVAKANAQANPPISPTLPVCSSTDSASLLECAGMKAQVPALQSVVITLGQLAATIAEIDHQYMTFYNAGLPAPETSLPDFMKNYCQGNNIPANGCCVYSSIAALISEILGGQPTTVSACRDPNANNAFPFIYNSPGQGVTDYTNASSNAAKNIYWQYAIAPILGNTPDVIGTNVNYYAGNINAAVTQAKLALPPDLKEWETEALQTGWLLAGTYYYRIAGMSNSSQASSLPSLTVNGTDPYTTTTIMTPFRNNYSATGNILTAIQAAASNTLSSSAPPAMQSAYNTLNSAANNITNNFENELTGSSNGSSNPLVSAQAFGEALLISAQVAYPIFLLVVVAILVIASLNGMGLGSGLTVSPAEAAVMFIVYTSWFLMMAFCGWCFTFGGMLAVYVPLIPYIIFTFGAIGWFTATIEAMAAAPFVALGILSPNAQHELLGKAEPAILILLNTFLRPTLMVLGMMAGMLLAPLMVSMINSGFNAVMGSIYSGSGHGPGPVELVLFISAYATLVVTTLNKCFSLIYMIPERVLTWIGGHASSAGEAESLGVMKSGAEATTGGIKKGASSAADTSMKHAGKGGKKDEKKGGGGNVGGGKK